MAVTSNVITQWSCPEQGGLGAISGSITENNSSGVGQQTTIALTGTATQLVVPSGTTQIIIVGLVGNTTNIVIGSTATVTNCPEFSPTGVIKYPYVSGNVYLSVASSTGSVQVTFL